MTNPSWSWRQIALWVFSIKAAYLSCVSLAVWLWSDFDEEQCRNVAASWFAPQGGSSVWQGGSGFARHFATWDAQHYVYLSEAGYSKGVKSCAFYPLWPLVIGWCHRVVHVSPLVSGMLLANLFSLCGWLIFYRVTADRFGQDVALKALALLVAFPGSLFYQFIYSESLFFLLVMMLWGGLERERFWLAWSAAVLLPLCRGVGVFTLLPICWWCFVGRRGRSFDPRHDARRGSGDVSAAPVPTYGLSGTARGPDPVRSDASRAAMMQTIYGGIALRRGPLAMQSRRQLWKPLSLLGAVLLGWVVYLLLMVFWTGNPFEGMDAQKYWGVHSIRNLWDVPKFVVGYFQPSAWHAFSGSVLDRCGFLLLTLFIGRTWRLGVDMLLWTCALGILPAMSGTFTSYIRFESAVFPLFIAVAFSFTNRGRRWPFVLFLSASAILHAVLVWRLVNFRWAG